MAPGWEKPRVRESDFNWKATTMPDRVRGICCARRLPPNFGGPRSIMDISIFHILRSSVSLERASRKREGVGEGDRRKLEWFSNRFPFQVRAPANTRRQGLSNSQPPGLPFRKLSFKCLRTGYELAQHLYLYTFHCAVSKSIDQDRQLYSIGSSYLTDQSFFFLFFFQKEFFYTSYPEITRENFWFSTREFKYFPKLKNETWIEIRSTRSGWKGISSSIPLILPHSDTFQTSISLYLYQNTFIESILLQNRFEFVHSFSILHIPPDPFLQAKRSRNPIKNRGGRKNPQLATNTRITRSGGGPFYLFKISAIFVISFEFVEKAKGWQKSQ